MQPQKTYSNTFWKQQSPLEVYKIGEELGRGKFGVTSRATHLATGEDFAIKAISKHQPEYNEKVVQREVDILARLSAHPNIAGLHELFEDAGFKYIVLELCSGGELFDLIVERGYFTEKEVAIVARTILQVIAHCHSKGILHRDLKPENFLLKKRDGSIEKDNVRAVDFGLSTSHVDGQVCRQVVGSAYYLAPEVLQGHYSWPCDAWSAGVMIYIMLSGMPPFWGRTDQEIFGRVLREPLDLEVEPWGEVSDPAKDLVAKLLNRDAKTRITPKDALKHPWIRELANIPDKPMNSVMLTRLKQFTAMSKFKTLLLNLVAKHLAPSEIGSLRDSFLAMDTDGTGFLTVEKLQNGLSRCSVDPRTTDVRHLMRHLDIQHGENDEPAQLSYEDFLAAALDTQKTLSAQSLGAIFAALDQDGDGYLTAEEIASGLQNCDVFADVEDVIHMMEAETISDVNSPTSRKHNMHNLHRISVAGFVDIIQQSAKGELQVARLDSAARQMSAFAQSNRLRQLASLMVARNSPAEELQELRELFSDLDEDNTGTISVEKLQAGLEEKCSLNHAEVVQITSALDVNHDGQVNYEEFVASAAAQQNLLTDAKLTAAFDLIDSDGDGIISKEDMEEMLTQLEVDVGELDALMQLAGADGDGKVTREQFEELMKSPVVAKPNLLNRVSMAGGGSLPRWSMAPPAPSPFDNMVEMPEDDEDEEEPAPAPAAPVPIPAPPTRQGSSNPVQSLMSAMEAKWMSGAGIGRIKSIPKSIKKGVRRHQTS